MNASSGGRDFDDALALLARDDPAPDLEAIRRREERDELMRRACLSALERARGVDPSLLDQVYLAWARDFVATHPPLNRHLGTGEPNASTAPAESADAAAKRETAQRKAAAAEAVRGRL